MAVTHICLNCGLDLARVRAHRDSEYDLWIVRCPRCTACCARNTGRARRTWTNFVRLDMALSIIVVQLLIALAMLLATRGILLESLDQFEFLPSMENGHEWNRTLLWSAAATMEMTWRDWPAAMQVVSILMAVGTGIWLTAAFSHIRKPYVWIGWSALVLCSMLIAPGRFYSYDNLVSFLLLAAICIIPLVVFMGLATLGIPIGHALRWLHGCFRRARWRWRRRQHRKWASGT